VEEVHSDHLTSKRCGDIQSPCCNWTILLVTHCRLLIAQNVAYLAACLHAPYRSEL